MKEKKKEKPPPRPIAKDYSLPLAKNYFNKFHFIYFNEKLLQLSLISLLVFPLLSCDQFCCFHGNIIAKGGLCDYMEELSAALQVILLENHIGQNVTVLKQWLLIINDQHLTIYIGIMQIRVWNMPTNFKTEADLQKKEYAFLLLENIETILS